MNEKDELFAFALASVTGMIARGATPAEIRDMAWVYAQFAINGKPQDEEV
jgi:hypothetical protein